MLLEVQHIRKAFPNGTRALNDVSFSVDAGEFVSVIGPSGAGKTTLFRILNGALLCDAGEILVSGVHFEAAGRRQRRAIQATIGTIYQDYALVENATCRQNVLNACLPDMAFLPAVCGLFGKARIAAADALLERVGLLDPVTGRQILTLLRDIQRDQQLTILMNSHNLELSQEFSNRLIGLNGGAVVFDGPADTPAREILPAVYGGQEAQS